jgi:hypothetical protein
LNRVPIVRVFIASLLALAVLSSTLGPATAQDATPAGSSIEEPLAIGTPGQVGDYEITVLSVIPDAANIVLAYNQFNSDPAPGTLFFLARIQVTYVGETSGSPWLELSLNAVGANPDAPYTEFENSCGDIPESGSLVSTELFTGGTIEYNICWAIDRADAGSLAMDASSYAGNGDQKVWFSLGDPSLATPEAPATPEATPVALASARFEPLPVGTPSLVGTYSVEVVSVEPNATELILESDSLSDPPADGNQYFLVTVSVTNQGEGPASPWFDLNFKSVGDLSVGYNEYNNSCGTIPESGLDVGDLAPGDTVEFNVCWQIPATEAASLVMYVDPSYAMNQEGRTWFSVQP